MNIAIYGAGKLGRQIKEKLQGAIDNSEVTVVFIDNYLKCEYVEGLPVHSEKNFLKNSSDFDIIVMAIGDPIVLRRVITKLKRKWTKPIYQYNFTVDHLDIPVVSGNGKLGPWASECKTPVLDYLEIQVIDVCNINCKYCSHFSNIFLDEWRLDTAELAKSLELLKSKFFQIRKIRIIGGEPLLNNSLYEYISLIRSYFPLTGIFIATNGILIPRMPSNLIRAIQKYSVRFDITQYIPTKKNLESIVSFLEANEIAYHISPLVTNFSVRMTNGESNIKQSFENCKRKRCKFYRNSNLYRCPFIPLLYEKREYFKILIKDDEIQKETISLANTKLDGWEILNFFDAPSALCRFCTEQEKIIEWSTGKPSSNDWIVK